MELWKEYYKNNHYKQYRNERNTQGRKKMENRKQKKGAVDVPTELLKYGLEILIEQLQQLFNWK